jgi:pyruvate/2-oxoglutarate dehydrogenase complex dihydrolipoamide acyltransferase (E2) component
VRALARKLKVDLSLVQASGPDGTITRADVERAARSLTKAGPARIDVGIAVDTDGRLIVLVLCNVGACDGADLRKELNRLRADVQARAIPPEELRGATITLSNFCCAMRAAAVL